MGLGLVTLFLIFTLFSCPGGTGQERAVMVKGESHLSIYLPVEKPFMKSFSVGNTSGSDQYRARRPDGGWQEEIQDTIPSDKDSILKVGYPVEKSLPQGYVKNGTVDYTKYLQAAVNKYLILIFPNFPVLVNDQGLKIPSNRKILFLPGSKLVVKPSEKGNYKIIYMNNVSDICLYNPVIVGDRYAHFGNHGEWGMGISIYSSRNITIFRPDISNCWGDGIYISQNISGAPPENITIYNAYCHSNRRNGITLISGINIKLIRPEITNSDGTLPMAGIDIEPNSPDAELKNILIQDPYTVDNEGKGIQIGLGKLVKRGIKPVSITINNHRDVGSKTGMVLSCNPGKAFIALSDTSVDGFIRVSNPIWKDNATTSLRANGFRTQKILFEVTNPRIIDSGNVLKSKKVVGAILRNAVGKGGLIKIKNP